MIFSWKYPINFRLSYFPYRPISKNLYCFLPTYFHFKRFIFTSNVMTTPIVSQSKSSLSRKKVVKKRGLTLCLDGFAGFWTLFTLFSGPPFLATPFSLDSIATGIIKKTRQITKITGCHCPKNNIFTEKFKQSKSTLLSCLVTCVYVNPKCRAPRARFCAQQS